MWTDLRGHGESDASFASYGDVETAGDIIALVEELGGPAAVVGSSMGAGAAVLAAADRPELVSGLVPVGPFVRDGKGGPLRRMLLRLLMARPWVAASWRAYLPKLYAGQRPLDFDRHRSEIAGVLAGCVGLIWLAHIGMHRSLAFGLKYDDHFQHTHLRGRHRVGAL